MRLGASGMLTGPGCAACGQVRWPWQRWVVVVVAAVVNVHSKGRRRCHMAQWASPSSAVAASRREDACRLQQVAAAVPARLARMARMASSSWSSLSMQAPLSVHRRSGPVRGFCNNSSRSSDEKLGRLPLCCHVLPLRCRPASHSRRLVSGASLESTCRRRDWLVAQGRIAPGRSGSMADPPRRQRAQDPGERGPCTRRRAGAGAGAHAVALLVPLTPIMPCPGWCSHPAARRDACQMTAVALAGRR
jgi:hypothetical protein